MLPEWLDAAEQKAVARFDRLLAPIFAEAIEGYVNTLTAADPTVFDGVDAKVSMAVTQMIEEEFTEIYLTAAIDTTKKAPVVPDDFPAVVNQKAMVYESQATNRIVGASEALWADVRDQVVTNLYLGMDIDVMQEQVAKIGQFATGRAEAIARTETLGAYNGGDWDGYKALAEFGPTHKMWLATADARTRPSHVEVNGTVVEMDEPFQVGGVSMMRPHDPGAPAAEVVNCRCTTLAYWPGDELPDGTTVEGNTKPSEPAVSMPAVDAMGSAEAISLYQMGDYHSGNTNQMLWEGRYDDLTDDQLRFVAGLDAAMSPAGERMLLYRGKDFNYGTQQKVMYRVGDVIGQGGFVSTSSRKATAQQFAGGGGAPTRRSKGGELWEITVEPGTGTVKVPNTSGDRKKGMYHDEDEVLIERGGSLRIDSVRENSRSGITTIKATFIPEK